MLSKKKLLGILFIILILTLNGCGKNEEIKLGFIGDLTGSSSYISRSGLQGAQIAVDEYNALGGYDNTMVKLVVKDNLGDSEENESLLTEFENENVQVVIGPFMSEMIVPRINSVNTKNLLLISPTISSVALSKMDDNFIRLIGTLENQGIMLSNLVIKNNNKRIVIVSNDTNHSFTEALVNSFSNNFMSRGGTVVNKIAYENIHEEIDFLMSSIKMEELDGIVFLGDGFDTAFMAQNLRKESINKQLYLSLWSNTKDLIEEGGEAVDNVYILDFIDRKNSTKEFKEFKTKYFNKYGEEPTFSSVFTYESTQLYLRSIESVGYDDWTKIKKEIVDLKTVNGLQNNFEINRFGESNRKYIPYQIISGKYKIIDLP